jgi:2-polyprenyl-3-methyl-5-hydroxy-6-metoxy-1,4-benzoquinol methylase
MWSDTRLASRLLRKHVCSGCGLVRDGNSFSGDDLVEHYREAYKLNAADDVSEHQFFRNGKAIPRSEAMAAWMAGALASSDNGRSVLSVYEVGAGRGTLLARFAAIYPDATFAGCEVNEAAAAAARAKGMAVASGDETALAGEYDLIVASFVLEHVPSPVAFLRQLAAHLTPRGRIVIAQPMQDVESHDIYFVDHLHHFTTTHVEWVANAAGLTQVAIASSPWFAANASVHVLERGDVPPSLSHRYPHAIDDAIRRWEAIFARCRALPKGRYALFGGSEFSGLLRCYGHLDRLELTMVLDDVPQRYPHGVFGLPVRALDAVEDEELARLDAVILAMNPTYHAVISRRCAARGVAVVNPFEAGCHT